MDAARKFKTVDEYIDSFPSEVKAKLKELRKAIKKAAPQIEELISYNMPGYKQNGVVMYFSAYKNHISVFPRIAAFKKQLDQYKGGKGTVQLPYDEPLPLKLVAEMVKHQVKKNEG